MNITKLLGRVAKNLPHLDQISLVDVGAAGDIQPRWKSAETYLSYHGFEPDERSREDLLKKQNNCLDYQIYPFGLWSSSTNLKLNLCKKPQASSSYLPNSEILNRFPRSSRFEIESVIDINVKTLDECGIESVNFIKIDIQGGELDVLKGSQKTLSRVLGLEIEIEFLELYSNQPLFGEVCSYLKTYGFEFIDFVTLARWERTQFKGQGQCTFGDALFLKSPEMVASSGTDISNFIFICCLYNRFDLIDALLEHLPDNIKTEYEKAKEPINKLKKIHDRFGLINKIANRLMGDRYTSHLIY